MPYIFQYGSNCDAVRLNSPTRLAGGADDDGRAETVEENELAFNKWSKGNGCAAADLVAAPGTGRRAWGVLYGVSEQDLKKLARVEGPSYEPKNIRIRNADGEEINAITFVVKATARRQGLWTGAKYVAHIIEGLRQHGVPEYYVQRIVCTAIHTNTNANDAGAASHEEPLLTRLRTP